jgi:hypothetical protein
VEGSHGLTATVAAMGRINASAGNVDRANEILDKLLEARGQRYIPATDIAGIYSTLRNRDGALKWLEQAVEEHSMHLFFLLLDPRWNWLHDDPRYQTIARRLGLPSTRR